MEKIEMKQWITYDNLYYFLSKLKTIFSDITHKHTVADIENLQDTLDTMKSDVDTLEQTVADLAGNISYNIVSITQDEYNALTTVDANTLYIIEV